MTKAQKLQLRQSEVRQRLGEIAGMDELTDELKAEERKLTGELSDLETRFRAALGSEGLPEDQVIHLDREELERRSLLRKANVGKILQAVLDHSIPDGEEREAQQAHGLGPNQIPLDMLLDEDELRAVSTAPTDTGANQQQILLPVFASPSAAFLSVPQPRVSAGDAVYPVLSTRPSVKGPFTDSTSADDTTASFTSQTLKPERLQAAFFWRRTDQARFPVIQSSLRQVLGSGLMEKLDEELIAGTNGLLSGTNLANHNVSDVTSFANYSSQFGFARVDGRFVDSTARLRIVVGSGTYAHMGSTYRSNESDMNALDRLMRITGGVRVSAHVPAVSGNKQNGVIRLGMRRAAVQPIWEGVTLIPDQVTKAATGEILVTAVLLSNLKILRTDDFWKQETKHAA